jgi:hypothetical protein
METLGLIQMDRVLDPTVLNIGSMGVWWTSAQGIKRHGKEINTFRKQNKPKETFLSLTCSPSPLSLSFIFTNNFPAAVGRPGVAAPPPELVLSLLFDFEIQFPQNNSQSNSVFIKQIKLIQNQSQKR